MSSSLPPTLPALSVVLGLPFYRRRRNTDIDTNSNKLTETANQHQDNNIPSEVLPTTTAVLSFDQRVTNNVARIYARRVINRARLDRERDNLVGGSSPHFQSSSLSAANVDSSLLQSNGDTAGTEGSSLQSEPTLTESTSTNWKDDLLRETLVSIINLKEKANKVKSLTSYDDNNNNNLLNLLDTSSLSSILLNNNNKIIAQCESTTTLETKPAEWSDDIDLVQKRLEFGKEISPLSNTTRLQRWGMACKRIATLGMLVAPLGVLVPCNLLLGKVSGGGSTKDESSNSPQQQEQSESTLQRCHANLTSKTWNYALWAIESAGPTYIKLVQWASTRNDLFSPEFVGHFSKLQDETRGHTWKETEATLHRAYGPNWKNVLSFDKIIDDGDDDYDINDSEEGKRLKRKGGKENRERQKRLLARNETKSTSGSSSKSSSSSSAPTIPIGSGCVAQVYKARLTKHHGLNPPGTSVAVKVQHPNILEKVCLDFYILNKLASALEYIPYLNLDYLSMKDSVDQFRDIMLPQLDLRVEAHNLQRFRRDFEGETQISFPEPFLGLTSREVLVERFVEVRLLL